MSGKHADTHVVSQRETDEVDWIADRGAAGQKCRVEGRVEFVGIAQIADVDLLLRILSVVDYDNADRTQTDVFVIADGVVVVQPDTCRGGPTKGVPRVVKSATGRHSVALLE